MPLPGTQDRARTTAPSSGAGRLTLQQPLLEPVISTSSTRCDLPQQPLEMRNWEAVGADRVPSCGATSWTEVAIATAGCWPRDAQAPGEGCL